MNAGTAIILRPCRTEGFCAEQYYRLRMQHINHYCVQSELTGSCCFFLSTVPYLISHHVEIDNCHNCTATEKNNDYWYCYDKWVQPIFYWRTPVNMGLRAKHNVQVVAVPGAIFVHVAVYSAHWFMYVRIIAIRQPDSWNSNTTECYADLIEYFHWFIQF